MGLREHGLSGTKNNTGAWSETRVPKGRSSCKGEQYGFQMTKNGTSKGSCHDEKNQENQRRAERRRPAGWVPSFPIKMVKGLEWVREFHELKIPAHTNADG